jgi:hypothetical protein
MRFFFYVAATRKNSGHVEAQTVLFQLRVPFFQALFIIAAVPLPYIHLNAEHSVLRNPTISRASACAALLVAAFFFGIAHADSLRCDGKLALQGDSRMEVRAKCGEPGDVVHSTLALRTTAARYDRVYYAEEAAIIVPVEIWTYNFGPHRFMYRLRFVNGVLEGLETMGYGFNAE